MRPTASLVLADRFTAVPRPERAGRVAGVVASVLALPPRPVVVVLGENAEQVILSADLDEATVVVNPEWRSGRSAALRAGFDVLAGDLRLEAALVATADRAAVDGRVAAALLDRFSRDSRLVVPKYRYEYDYPVLVGRAMWERLVAGTGEVLTFVKAHAGWVEEVWIDERPQTTHAAGSHWQGGGRPG